MEGHSGLEPSVLEANETPIADMYLCLWRNLEKINLADCNNQIIQFMLKFLLAMGIINTWIR